MLCLAIFSKHTILIAEPIKKSMFQIYLCILQLPQIQPDFQIAITYGSRYDFIFFLKTLKQSASFQLKFR